MHEAPLNKMATGAANKAVVKPPVYVMRCRCRFLIAVEVNGPPVKCPRCEHLNAWPPEVSNA